MAFISGCKVTLSRHDARHDTSSALRPASPTPLTTKLQHVTEDFNVVPSVERHEYANTPHDFGYSPLMCSYPYHVTRSGHQTILSTEYTMQRRKFRAPRRTTPAWNKPPEPQLTVEFLALDNRDQLLATPPQRSYCLQRPVRFEHAHNRSNDEKV